MWVIFFYFQQLFCSFLCPLFSCINVECVCVFEFPYNIDVLNGDDNKLVTAITLFILWQQLFFQRFNCLLRINLFCIFISSRCAFTSCWVLV